MAIAGLKPRLRSPSRQPNASIDCRSTTSLCGIVSASRSASHGSTSVRIRISANAGERRIALRSLPCGIPRIFQMFKRRPRLRAWFLARSQEALALDTVECLVEIPARMVDRARVLAVEHHLELGDQMIDDRTVLAEKIL